MHHDRVIMPHARPWPCMAALLLAICACVCRAQPVDEQPSLRQTRSNLVLSPATTYHFSREKHSYVWLVGAESQAPSGWLYGGSLFSNSFGQPSAYVFGGQRFDEPGGLSKVYCAWTAGLIYGYKGEHKNEIEPNLAGFAPAVIPRAGYQVTPRWSVEVAALGFAALMFSLNMSLNN